jgi:Mitochondrial carrier protein
MKGMFLIPLSCQDQALAGFGAGLVSTVILHPLDVIKIRFQGTCLKPLYLSVTLAVLIIKGSG